MNSRKLFEAIASRERRQILDAVQTQRRMAWCGGGPKKYWEKQERKLRWTVAVSSGEWVSYGTLGLDLPLL